MIFLPVLIFYAVLFRNLVNIPLLDDYAILNFIAATKESHGLTAVFSQVLSAQFNEYKVMFGAAVFTMQYYLLGHVNFSGLCILGDASVLVIGVALWKMFLPALKDISLRLALFVPVSWLLFQFFYSETLNWAAPAIQNLGVLAFAFAMFVLLVVDKRSWFMGALVCLVFAIAASGNGFIAAFVAFLALAAQRRLQHLLVWTATTCLMLLAYSYRYTSTSSQSARGSSVFKVLLHLKPLYAISFLGGIGGINLGAFLPRTAVSLSVGFLICLFFMFIIRHGKLSSNTAVNCAVGFLFLTAIGVAGIRSDLGLTQSLQSRYRIYSDLLVILMWVLLCERYAGKLTGRLIRNKLYLATCAVIVLFSLAADLGGSPLLFRRHSQLIDGLKAYEHTKSAGPEDGPAWLNVKSLPSAERQMNHEYRYQLSKAIKLGTYVPPF